MLIQRGINVIPYCLHEPMKRRKTIKSKARRVEYYLTPSIVHVPLCMFICLYNLIARLTDIQYWSSLLRYFMDFCFFLTREIGILWVGMPLYFKRSLLDREGIILGVDVDFNSLSSRKRVLAVGDLEYDNGGTTRAALPSTLLLILWKAAHSVHSTKLHFLNVADICTVNGESSTFSHFGHYLYFFCHHWSFIEIFCVHLVPLLHIHMYVHKKLLCELLNP